ncbi:undecaprenyldiphospho-muramoylpentapeptide beta-N-acetylglucosaminyltransferase, partial [Listeria monocytogenes]
ALIRELKKGQPDADYFFYGTEKGFDGGYVNGVGIHFEDIEFTGFNRSLSFENINTVMRFLCGA